MPQKKVPIPRASAKREASALCKQAVALAYEGLDRYQIAARLNCPLPTVTDWFKRHNLPRNSPAYRSRIGILPRAALALGFTPEELSALGRRAPCYYRNAKPLDRVPADLR